MDSNSHDSYLVRLESFEGPLDLLLHLIKKNEMDIYDIRVALITEQYCEYLDSMREMDLDILGEYMVMAAELGLIKSRMLVPQPESEEGIEDGIDPREELVRMLLEYQRYKDASEELREMPMLNRDVFVRVPDELLFSGMSSSNVEKTDLWMLISALRGIFKRQNQPVAETMQFELEIATVEDKIEEITTLLQAKREVMFNSLFGANASVFIIIVTFLAVLELLNINRIMLRQEMPFAPIELVYTVEAA